MRVNRALIGLRAAPPCQTVRPHRKSLPGCALFACEGAGFVCFFFFSWDIIKNVYRKTTKVKNSWEGSTSSFRSSKAKATGSHYVK